MIHNAPPAHTQKIGQPNSDFCGISVVNAKIVPPISANPTNSRALIISVSSTYILKSYIFFLHTRFMGKYAMVVLAFLIAGMIIASTSKPFNHSMFYSMLVGAVGIIGYTTWHNRKEHQRIRRERRRSKK
ncbi:MAG: putative membrane protein [Cenarchaeum symbiont of Oopsacas minuta]|nr:putative membrane protein [Cenarchaeum symbiont of Oopsacas minuta]